MVISKNKYDVVVLGAGASGIFCAGEIVSKSDKSVLVLDNGNQPLRKVKASGGGRCNFTNVGATRDFYNSQNGKFCISALKQFGPYDFVGMLLEKGISYTEKHKGQLFADGKSSAIIDFLMDRCGEKVSFKYSVEILSVDKVGDEFVIETLNGKFVADKVVVALGNKSFSKIGGTDFGAKLAENFGHSVVKLEPALVGFKSSVEDLRMFECLAGTPVEVSVKVNGKRFEDSLLFTHRGISGPAPMQSSLFWKKGDSILVNFLPTIELFDYLKELKSEKPKLKLDKVLIELLPKKFVFRLMEIFKIGNSDLANCADKDFRLLGEFLNRWQYKPLDTMGFDTAEVSRGGVCVDEVASRTMESSLVKGLYFVGEVLDVTGCLGGYNLQWAWSSAFVCAKDIVSE
ncbi:MAG: NAD(P)/FAD-dependent oxidoreductase [Alphaproteobacteria bacterium]|jgi:predicted Rossmann fold flavoprotein|nr:NAD(P)/FAD-dependent oxidoreductase [Alphaproteobacteria bacterium]